VQRGHRPRQEVVPNASGTGGDHPRSVNSRNGTIGQRKGIKLPEGPFYVLDKDMKRNLLVVTKNEKDLYKKELFVKNTNWIFDVKFPLRIMAKIRYRHKPASAIISKQKNNRVKVVFSKAQRAITPGQSVVFCKGQEVLGGGIIT